jgi:hypothetical protein
MSFCNDCATTATSLLQYLKTRKIKAVKCLKKPSPIIILVLVIDRNIQTASLTMIRNGHQRIKLLHGVHKRELAISAVTHGRPTTYSLPCTQAE